MPLALGAKTNLLGTRETIAGRIEAYRSAGVTTLLAKLDGGHADQLDALATLVDLVATS